MKRLLATFVCCAWAVAGPTGKEAGFADATRGSGIEFRYTFGGKKLTKIVEATGPGVALFDADGDGDLDVYLVNGGWLEGLSTVEDAKGATNRLYRNDGSLKFTDITAKAGVGDTGYGMGCVAADYDGDGDVDLYVTNYGPNVLFRNRGDGTFEDATAQAGVAGPKTLNKLTKWSTNAVFFDADQDNDLDLFVCNYLAFDKAFNEYYGPEAFPGPSSYLGQASLLYRNNGDGTFREVTKEVGLWQNDGRGMGASVADLDGDGLPDIFEANDNMKNHLFRNVGAGKFREVAVKSLVAYGQGGENTAAMHASAADYNADGLFDLMVADAKFSALYTNQGKWIFLDAAETSGLAIACGQYASWGGFFFDYDNDGWLDLFLANGGAHHLWAEQNLVLRGSERGHFRDVSLTLNRSLFRKKRTSRGAAFGDLDNDGDLDIVVANIDRGGDPTLYENRVAGGHWIGLTLEGSTSNRQALGAVVKVRADGREQTAYVQTAVSYLSSCDPRPHFGLGAATKIESVLVAWPSGNVRIYKGLDVDRYHVLKEEG
jgi:hypothetical protein